MSVPFPVCSVEDVANLTASDVMNRVNLGYLQGNSLSLESPVTHGVQRTTRSCQLSPNLTLASFHLRSPSFQH